MNNPEFNQAAAGIYSDAVKKFGIQQTPKLVLRKDEENAQKLYGRTAYYDPSEMTIVLYVTNRHPKDILRSFAHELIHHVQNERGDLQMGDASNPRYAQEDDHLRNMEKEAYLEGNLLIRDFEDRKKYS
jgi:thioredoxin-related protein